jgi:DNA-binding transcriptional MerR regulator
MKDLTEATGLPRSTILHYLHQGLLPQPVKTSPNMAYYHPGCIDRLRLIKNLQAKHRLSLAQIKEALCRVENGRELAAWIELQEAIFGSDPKEEHDLKTFCQRTGLIPEQVDRLLELELLLPLEEGRFDQEDVAMGLVLAMAMANGLDPEEITYYPRLAGELVDEEMALRNRLTGHLPYAQDASKTAEMTRAARVMRGYSFERAFQKRVLAMKGLKEEEEG